MKLTIDKAGRVVLPKPVRDKMRLTAGDELQLQSEGEQIVLRPVRPKATLKKEQGIWVYQGESTDASIPELIEAERDKRLRTHQDQE